MLPKNSSRFCPAYPPRPRKFPDSSTAVSPTSGPARPVSWTLRDSLDSDVSPVFGSINRRLSGELEVLAAMKAEEGS
eukprot:scaffold172270_cov41-Prasinocladus_malaysianus.AAC.1